MIRAILTVTQVMDLWDISLAILEQSEEDGQWRPIAAATDSLLADPDLNHDPVHSLLKAIVQWSVMTIQG